jgi:hypothetical protein
MRIKEVSGREYLYEVTEHRFAKSRSERRQMAAIAAQIRMTEY